MSTFTAIRKQVREDLQHKKSDAELKDRYLLITLYFSLIAYFNIHSIDKKLQEMGAKYISIYSFGDAHGFLAEFDTFVVVSFKGTEYEGLKHLKTGFTFWKSEFLGQFVHTGFLNVITRLGKKIENDLNDIDRRKKIIYTGHSLGGALCLLLALKFKPDEIVTFGAPKVSGDALQQHVDGIKITRVYTKNDLVAYIPPNIPKLLNYRHFGEEVVLEGEMHPLKTHKLRVYLKEILRYYQGMNVKSKDDDDITTDTTNRTGE